MSSASLAQTQSLYFLYATKLNLALSILSLASLSAFVFSLVIPIARYLDGLSIRDGSCGPKFAVLVFIALIVAWMPYVCAFAPGSTCTDITNQILQFEGEGPYSSHHPLVSTFVLGGLFSMGSSAFGDANWGLLAIVVAQTLAMASAITFEIVAMRRMGAPRQLIIGALLFFMLVPIFGSYCQWAVKDSLFASAFTAYATLFVACVRFPERFVRSKPAVAMLVALALLVGLLRNNGFYVVLLSLPFLCVLFRGTGGLRRMALIACIPIVLAPCVNSAAMALVDAQPGSVREALSIPFQQSARYAATYPNDVADWERDAIDAVLGYDTLAERYAPHISDPVKGKFDSGGSLGAYFAAWASQGIRHPMAYLEATAIQTYGYWSVLKQPKYGQEYASYDYYHDPERMGWGPWTPDAVRDKAVKIISLLRNAPFLSCLSQAGLYTWLLLFGCAYLAYKKRYRDLIAFLPCLTLLLTCIAGPLNGSIRYALGIIEVAPLMLLFSMANPGKRDADDAVKEGRAGLARVEGGACELSGESRRRTEI